MCGMFLQLWLQAWCKTLHTHTRTHRHTYTYTQAHIHVHTRTHTRTHIHVHTRTHARTLPSSHRSSSRRWTPTKTGSWMRARPCSGSSCSTTKAAPTAPSAWRSGPSPTGDAIGSESSQSRGAREARGALVVKFTALERKITLFVFCVVAFFGFVFLN